MNQQVTIATGHAAFDPATHTAHARAAKANPVIIIGGGPVGIRTAQELSRRGIDCVVFNDERWLPYNRVKLTPLLCGDAQIGSVMQSLTFPGPGNVELHSNCSVVGADIANHRVTVSNGEQFAYSRLVICTGSRAHVPPFPGRQLAGVFTFRDASDVEKLIARATVSRRTVVIGGGLLGLEAARGMAARGTDTWVVEHNPYLMPRQLDDRGGKILGEKIEALGLKIKTGAAVSSIDGNGRVEGLTLADGTTIVCDTVIICTGIRANIDLARNIGVPVGDGITVDAQMKTGIEDVYAAGECAQFDGNMYGLVGPGFEQAVVVARNIAGDVSSYIASIPSTKLKIIGTDVFSMGDVEQLAQRNDVRQVSFEDRAMGGYRTIVLKRTRLVGAMAIGEWPEINRVQEAIRTGCSLYPWQLHRFRRTGSLWRSRTPQSVLDWPRSATLCNCTGATRGQVGDAIALGATCFEDVKRDTGASTVCGSCRVHVEELLGTPPAAHPIAGWKVLLGISAATAFAGVITLVAPRVPFATTIQFAGLPERLWLDGFWKQVSGYMLLALCVIAAALSIRKRVGKLALGSYDGWRVAHAALGLSALFAVFAHTGFRLGHNLNAWLMITFVMVTLAGAGTSVITAIAHRYQGQRDLTDAAKSATFWLHVLSFWPLPLLLAIHVLSVYFY